MKLKQYTKCSGYLSANRNGDFFVEFYFMFIYILTIELSFKIFKDFKVYYTFYIVCRLACDAEEDVDRWLAEVVQWFIRTYMEAIHRKSKIKAIY